VELAQLICKRSAELGAADSPDDVPRAALRLVRAAHYDRATLQHASAIFRTRLRGHPEDAASADGLRLLTKVLAFLR
jgi:hypothetical protein